MCKAVSYSEIFLVVSEFKAPTLIKRSLTKITFFINSGNCLMKNPHDTILFLRDFSIQIGRVIRKKVDIFRYLIHF
jgi:hypothetical protein